MKYFFVFLCFLTPQLLCVASGWSHGAWGSVALSEGRLVTAEYDDGNPMSYAGVEIKGPESDIPFQKGRTDRNGRFMFSPDRDGHWKIAVEDGMGHRLALGVEVKGDTVESEIPASLPQGPSASMTRVEKIIMGLSIIFGIFGLCYGWKGRRTVQKRTW